MKVLAIIQARMGSTRLPGKILKEVNGKPLLSYQLHRLKASKLIDEIVIATTKKEQDDVIEAFCKKFSVSIFRGSESDVLKRYYEAAIKLRADVIVRITSDCPIIDPEIVDNVIHPFLESKNFDYVSNTIERTFPRGFDVEVFSFNALEEAEHNAFLDRDREHVTPYFYTNTDKFNVCNVYNDVDYSKYRFTVDTQEDFELIKLILEHLYDENPYFKMLDVIRLMEKNPIWFSINAHIEQKKI